MLTTRFFFIFLTCFPIWLLASCQPETPDRNHSYDSHGGNSSVSQSKKADSTSSFGSSGQKLNDADHLKMDIPKSGLNFAMIKRAFLDFFRPEDIKHSNTATDSTDNEQGSNTARKESTGIIKEDLPGEMAFSTPKPLSDLQVVPQMAPSSSADNQSESESSDDRKPQNDHKPNDNATSLFQKGETARKNGLCENAITWYEKTIEADPLFVAPLAGIYQCHLDRQQFAKAKVFRAMAITLQATHLAKSARDMNPPLSLQEWRMRSQYEQLSQTEKKYFDENYQYLADHLILFNMNLINGFISLAQEYGYRYTDSQKWLYHKNEKWFYNQAAKLARTSLGQLGQSFPPDHPDYIYYKTVFLLWEIKSLYWAEKFDQVYLLCEAYKAEFPERYAEEEIDYWYYLPSREKMVEDK